MSMIYWSDHNSSITVHVREHEWDEKSGSMIPSTMSRITFSPYGEIYPLLPYETTTAMITMNVFARLNPSAMSCWPDMIMTSKTYNR